MNYYEILEVSPNASKEVIKAAYKSLIQRYHPDKNPDNAEIAAHASLVVQAYDVLSDLDKRAAYNLQLKQQSIAPTMKFLDRGRDVYVSDAYTRRRSTRKSKSYWYVWLPIILIILSSWVMLSLAQNRQVPESGLKEIGLSITGKHLTQDRLQNNLRRMDAILNQHPEIQTTQANTKAHEETPRTIPIFITQLTVHLNAQEKRSGETGNVSADTGKESGDPGKELGGAAETSADAGKSSGEPANLSGDSGHVLSIPVLNVEVGSFDPEKIIRHLLSKTGLISQKLAESLAIAKYDELVKIGGEQYLKNIILDSINDTIGTNRFEDYPSSSEESPGRYGVVEVFFPESFTVR